MGQQSSPTSPPVYRAAIIGVGRAGPHTSAKGGGHQIGHTHAQTVLRNPRMELVAAADISRENLTAFLSHFTVPDVYADHTSMLAEARPDIVSICTYVGLHRRMIVDAAHAGVRGIICEKPFLASPADLAAVSTVATETGVKIIVPHIRRYFPVFARAKQLYTGGAIGEPVLCFAGIPGWDLSEWGSHWLDMFRFFHDDRPIRWVFGQQRVRSLRGYGHAMEEHGMAYFEFEQGGKGLLDGGEAFNGGHTMVLTGTQGVIRIEREHTLHITDLHGTRVESFQEDPHSSYAAVWDLSFASLLDWLDGGPEPMLGLSNVLKTAELNLAAYLSSLQGDRVDLPLSDFALDEWPVEALARRAALSLQSEQ